jgi:hypothetical protein
MNLAMVETAAESGPGLADRIRRHIEGRFATSSIETSPFPHMIIEDFFPADVYANILAYNPFRANQGREWASRVASAEVTSRTPYHARKHINFHVNDQFEAPPRQREFWTALSGIFLQDEWFERLVFDKYPAFFEIRFGDLMQDEDCFRLFRKEVFLQRHEPGYYIGPHTDVPTRVFTCIFSFADRSGFEEYGTELCVHKDRLVRCWGNDHYGPEDFIVRKVAPYRPNNFLLFFKTRHSFHAVKAITEAVPNQRYGMQFQLYEQKDGLFRDLSDPDLMKIRRTNTAAGAGALLDLGRRAARKVTRGVLGGG